MLTGAHRGDYSAAPNKDDIMSSIYAGGIPRCSVKTEVPFISEIVVTPS